MHLLTDEVGPVELVLQRLIVGPNEEQRHVEVLAEPRHLVLLLVDLTLL